MGVHMREGGGGLTPFGLVPRPGNVNAGQPLGTTENCGLLATAGHKCQRFSPGFSGSTEMMLWRLQSETRN